MKYRSSAFYEGALVKVEINGQNRCTRVTRRSPLSKERRGLDRDAWKQRTRIKNCYDRSFYSFTMGFDVNRHTDETLCPYRNDLSNGARRVAPRRADIRYVSRFSRFSSSSLSLSLSPSLPLCFSLIHSVHFVRKT